MTYRISTGAHYHWVKRIGASTNGNGVLKLTLRGNGSTEFQFDETEITIFTDDVNLTDRLVKAINSAAAAPSLADQEMEARAECERRGLDPDELCADGGIEAWMIVAQEMRR